MATDMEKHLVAVAFDDAKTDPGALGAALAKGEYPPEGEPRRLASMPARTDRVHVGKISRDSLLRDYPMFAGPYRDYAPRGNIVGKIAALKGSFDILVFFGTWSGESAREVPKILKTLDAAGNPNVRLALYGVDREKKDGLGMSERFDIRREPTTVVLRDGIERGRIVDPPATSNEEELLKILEKL